MKLPTKIRMGAQMAAAAVFGRRRPVFVGWSLTDTCNLSCDYCGRWDRGSSEMPNERMLEVAREMVDAGVQRVALTGGEPLVHPMCLPIVDLLAAAGVDVTIHSNGLLVPKHLGALTGKLAGLTVSVDGGPVAHDIQRGAKAHQRAVTGARAARSAGLSVDLHMVVTRHNLGEAEAVLELAGSLGGKAGFTIVRDTPAMGRRDLAPLTPKPEEWHRFVDDLIARRKAGDKRIQNSIAGLEYLRNWPVYAPITCSAGVVYARIEPDGSLYGCGNLVRKPTGRTLATESFGEAFKALVPDSCRACWCDTRVEMNLILSGSPSALHAAWLR